MELLHIDPVRYRAELGEAMATLVERCRDCIAPLCERYGIRRRRVLSIGAGMAHEEMLFLEQENAVYAFDSLQDGESMRELLRSCIATGETAFHYCMGDATRQNIDAVVPQGVDVLYSSSFTPDELRREGVRRRWQGLWRHASRVFGQPPFGSLSWPGAMVSTLHPCLRRMLAASLRPGELFILQSYCGGVDVSSDRKYIGYFRLSLARLGVQLLEAYHLEAAPGVSLWVGRKGSLAEALTFARQLDETSPLARFHGRAELDNTARRCFHLAAAD